MTQVAERVGRPIKSGDRVPDDFVLGRYTQRSFEIVEKRLPGTSPERIFKARVPSGGVPRLRRDSDFDLIG